MSCGCSGAAGLGASMNTYNGPVPPGVPNPYTVMLHSYPTRYHGPIYTRPMYNLAWAPRPNDFALDESMMGLGEEPLWAAAGLGVDEASISPMEPWKVVVGLGLAVGIVWLALKVADRSYA